MSEDKHFDLSMQFAAITFVIFAIHCSLAAVSYQRPCKFLDLALVHVARAPSPALLPFGLELAP